MTARKLGTLTIGLAPRSDFTAVLERNLPPSTNYLHAGVLDGLCLAEIEAEFAPRDGEPVLISRLPDGKTVVLGQSPVEAMLQRKAEMLERQGCGAILILCTGRFDHLSCKSAWLLEPDRMVPPAVAALVGERRAGIIVPLPDQIEEGLEKWALLSEPPLCTAASPFGDDGDLVQAALTLKEQGAGLLVLDCMGFSERHRHVAKEASGLPVILSISLIARLTAEML